VRGDGVLQALAHQYLGGAYYNQGDYRRAIDCLRQAVASLDGARRHERCGQAFLPSVNSRAWLAVCHAELGLFAEGSALGEEGLRIAEAVDHPGSLMCAARRAGLLSLRQGDLPKALLLLEQAMGICQDADFPTFFSLTAAALGAVYTLAGRIAEAIPWLMRALERASTADSRAEAQVFCCLSLGEAQMLAGQLAEAQSLAGQALMLAREHQERGHEAYALRLLGDLAAQHDCPECEPAVAYYQQALRLADELGMRPLMAHCHYGLGRLYCQTGRSDQARTELSTAIELYRAMDMTFWLPRAEAALA
jgi:tetratricopeptide (TPR) repeat protein